MKIRYFVAALMATVVLFAGCNKGTGNSNNGTTLNLDPQPQQDIQKPLTDEEIKKFTSEVENTKRAFASDGSEENKKAYIKALSNYAFALVNSKGNTASGFSNFDQGLDTYKELYKVDEPNSEARKKLLRYLLTLNLDQINAKNIPEADRMANALYEIRPDEFYVQARMIMVAGLKRDKAYEEGNYEEALTWARKANTYRYDAMALEGRVKLEIEVAEKYLEQDKTKEAEELIRNITYTVQLSGNESLLKIYGQRIDNLVKKYEGIQQSIQ